MIRLLALLLIWIGFGAPALAQPIEARSEHFTLLSEAQLDAESILSDLEQFRVAVMTDLDMPIDRQDRPLRLNIINDPDVFAAISPGGITAAIYLQSAAGHDIVVGYSDNPDALLGNALDPGGLRLMLRHELVHHLLETHYPRKLPIWLGEGLAEYYATYEVTQDGQARFGRALPEQDPLSDTDSWIPMRTIIENMARYPDFRTIPAPSVFRAQRLYYGQSWALADFIMDQPDGLARIHHFVDRWEPDSDSEDSFEHAFGLRYAPLEQQMRRAKADRQPDSPASQNRKRDTDQIQITTLKPKQLTANRLRLLLSHGRISEQTDRRLAALRSQTPIRDIDIRLAEAHYHWRHKDWDKADAITANVLSGRPSDPNAWLIRAKTAYGRVAERQMDETLWAAAEITVRQALRINPDNSELHLFRVAVSLPDATGLSDSAKGSLNWLIEQQTHLRMPHSAMMMIPALIYERRLDHADRVLDSAARWSEGPTDQIVIDRLRGAVLSERAREDD